MKKKFLSAQVGRHFYHHPQSGVIYLWWHLTDVRMTVWLSVIRWLSKSLTWKVHVSSEGTSSWDTGQVRVWRSSGRDQGHRFTKSGHTSV